jgi:hypothetical protein
VYAIARFFPDVRAASPYLTNPRYRLHRIVQPALASVGGTGDSIVVILLLLGIAGCVLAAGAVADIEGRRGSVSIAGYLVALLLVPSVASTTNEPLAAVVGLLALALVDRGRWLPAAFLLEVAVLTRETAVVFVFAAAVALLAVRRVPAAVGVVTIPAGALLAWAGYLRATFPGQQLPRSTGLFEFVELGTTVRIVVAASVLVCAIGAVLWRDVVVLWTVCAAFAVASLFFHDEIYNEVYPLLGVPRVASVALGLGIAGVVRKMRSVPPSSLTAAPMRRRATQSAGWPHRAAGPQREV